MSVLDSIHRLILLAGLAGLVFTASGEEPVEAAALSEPAKEVVETAPLEPVIFRPRPFEVIIRPGETAGWEQMRRVLIYCGTNQFSIIAPVGCRISSAADKVTLAAADSSYFLTFRIMNRDIGPQAAEVCRNYVTDQFPQARLLAEYEKSAAGHVGPAFTLRGKVVGTLERSLHVAIVPSAVGALEFTSNADSSKAPAGEAAFNALLRSFRSNEHGKLDIIIRTLDKS